MPGLFAWSAYFGSFSRQYGENAVFSFLNWQKVLYPKILEFGSSFTVVFTGSYFCRTEAAMDVSLLLRLISFCAKGDIRRRAMPGGGHRIALAPQKTHLYLHPPSNNRQVFTSCGGRIVFSAGEVCCDHNSSLGSWDIYCPAILGKSHIMTEVPPFSHFWGVEEYLAFLFGRSYFSLQFSWRGIS